MANKWLLYVFVSVLLVGCSGEKPSSKPLNPSAKYNNEIVNRLIPLYTKTNSEFESGIILLTTDITVQDAVVALEKHGDNMSDHINSILDLYSSVPPAGVDIEVHENLMEAVKKIGRVQASQRNYLRKITQAVRDHDDAYMIAIAKEFEGQKQDNENDIEGATLHMNKARRAAGLKPVE